MELDGRSIPDGGSVAGDVLVIGAGPVGIAVAIRLANAGASVVVLEGGGLEREPATDDLLEGTIVGGVIPTALGEILSFTEMNASGLGGTSHYWAGLIQPLRPRDLSPKPFNQVSGWPLAWSDLDPWFNPAARFLHLGEPNWNPAASAPLNTLAPPPDLGGRLTEQLVLGRWYSLANEYRAAIVAHPNLTLIHHANAAALTTSAGGEVVTGTEVRTTAGTSWLASAPKVVLACGGVGTPRLLLSSTDHHPAGLGNDADLVGRYYTDHPKAQAWVLASAVERQAWEAIDARVPKHEDVDRGDGSQAERGVSLHLRFSDSTLAQMGWPDAQAECSFSDDLAALHPNFKRPFDLMAAQGTPMACAGVMTVTTEQPLDRNSRVTLGDDTDAVGRRRAVLDWRVPDSHAQTVRDMVGVLGDELGRRGIGRVMDATDRLTYDWDTFELAHPERSMSLAPEPPPGTPIRWRTSYHQMCTTRMATSPTEGVVDADCKVHGVDNLWVAGTSVFATGAGYVPTLTGVALALRLAARLEAL